MKAYQTSPTVEAARSWDRRYVDARDLFRMVAWKSAQGLASLTLNSNEGIEACTGHVIAIIEPYRDSDVFDLRKNTGEWEAFLSVTERALSRDDGLRSLHGIAMPTASAILALLNGRAWPVIDRWATQALFGRTISVAHMDWFRTYRQYLEGILAVAPSYPGENVHQIDQGLMNTGRDAEETGRRPAHEPIAFDPPPRRRRK